MSNATNIYEIQAFSYSQFQHHILLHEEKFSEVQLRKMVEIAKQKAKKRMTYDDDFYWKHNYPDDVIAILKEDYGFKSSEHLVAYVGCDYDDKSAVERSD